ncbi:MULTISPECIES: RluA family pseudouridine synthase [Prauserella salsuginis group]|uniref:RNA pseudouridylate synthase n=2 Tax=Prauserella salsuginis group TaxID=2893672 RepID=A0A839XFP6_9PSEU|nr:MULTISPECIES: RluA family pseudouridine synthase [Prauserella salsuginis group]MBB3661581.1 tRNA pseudouridine32 synthase/23S rRNA pseudouridine746 synthase [Prauserella sediminis]MCR3719497.1 tRNA pseudouridine32 synthase / 23S rRNA pseudouridine746 synthase [Prauserella flava]MCR3735489.1 tRNA pseudouridine32 synthase / 23S rRNA pseudouridine746 synthase [Prauserella salsuginis]
MKRPVSPLPQRNGLDAARLRLPVDGTWATVRDHLVQRLHRLEPAYIDDMLAAGRFVTTAGPVTEDTPYVPGDFVWFHRDLPDEVPVPFDIGIVHRDDDLVVADKPHFLATIPRGKHVMQTALVRLRDELGLPELSPVHRLDRVTAGLLMFTVRRELRGPYQNLFRDRTVHKEYEAIAPHDPQLALPRTVRSRIVKRREVVTAEEVPGEPNAETYVELVEARDGLGRYRLVPATGRTHQLRVHLASLGVPIVGDSFYPVTYETALDDFRNPLQLLAKVLEFTDPLTGERRRFESDRTLSAWPG